MSRSQDALAMACHDCDQLHARIDLGPGERALCSRCGALLARSTQGTVERTFAYALASMVLLLVANLFPFMEFEIGGRVQQAHLFSGIQQLYADGYWELGAMVLFTSIFAPLVLIGCLLLLSGPILAGVRVGWMRRATKIVLRLKVWSMMEVFMLGVIVSAIKLSDMAEILFGPAFFAFGALIVTSTMAISAFEPAAVWKYLDQPKNETQE